MLPLGTALFLETNPMPVKAALAKMGMIKNVLRLPLVSMTDESAARMDPVLKELGLI
jgi:4-hydroxy-tetrahydrodipicolinate synthase